MRHCLPYFATLCLCLPIYVMAEQSMSQFTTVLDSQFKHYAESLSTSQSYKALSGMDGSDALALDIGFEIATTRLERDSFLKSYTSKTSPDLLRTPKLHISTRHNEGWNAGAFYTSVPDSDIQIYGGELQYLLMPNQRSLLPSLSVRGTYSQMSGVDDLFVTSTGLELSVSKGFQAFTPYAGIGTMWLDGEYELEGYTSRLTQNKYFLGLQFNLGAFRLSAEAEQSGEESTIRAKSGFRF
ncbi:MAG TPA: hypothetical protein VIM41_02880 [Gammaproteobacteria bacterium]